MGIGPNPAMVYRRGPDRKGENFRDHLGTSQVVMIDMSSPVMVKGRHWGAVRLAYKID